MKIEDLKDKIEHLHDKAYGHEESAMDCYREIDDLQEELGELLKKRGD